MRCQTNNLKPEKKNIYVYTEARFSLSAKQTRVISQPVNFQYHVSLIFCSCAKDDHVQQTLLWNKTFSLFILLHSVSGKLQLLENLTLNSLMTVLFFIAFGASSCSFFGFPQIHAPREEFYLSSKWVMLSFQVFRYILWKASLLKVQRFLLTMPVYFSFTTLPFVCLKSYFSFP